MATAKKPVYNGYEEAYLTGSELREKYATSYLAIGRHHSRTICLSIPRYLDFKKIERDRQYRVFFNSSFCRIMDENTDKLILFFGLEPFEAAIDDTPLKTCPVCGGAVCLKESHYGPFWGRANYPKCKFTYGITTISRRD